MPWGDAGVSKRLILSTGGVAWGTGGVQATTNIPQTGILRKLRLHHEDTPTFTPGTGTVTLDTQGPWNKYTRFILSPNSQAPIFNASGLGLALINNLIQREAMGGTPDTVTVSPVNGETATDVYNGSAITGSTSLRYYQDLPVAQVVRSLGGEVGLFPLQNPAVQLALNWTPNSPSAASPYNIASTTAGVAPYLVTNPATVVIASPTLEVIRDLWEVPQNRADYPPFNFVSSWSEEGAQGSVVGATTVQWNATPLSGILVRVIAYIYDGATNAGILPTSLTASNAMSLIYGSGTAKFAETGAGALTRQRDELGHDMPRGSYFYDLLGSNLTLQDSLNLFKVGNVSMQVNVTSALAAGSSAKFLRQLIQPLVVQA